MDGVSCTQISWGGYHNYRKSKKVLCWRGVCEKKERLRNTELGMARNI